MDRFVSAVFSSLRSEFMTLPKGAGFVEYRVFEAGYEEIKKATEGFRVVEAARVLPVVMRVPVSFIVLRAILGFSPPEWAYAASQTGDVEVSQGFVRALDRRVRIDPVSALSFKPGTDAQRRICALVVTACNLINGGAPAPLPDRIHRLDKADTRRGASGLVTFADIGVPYAMLLYERFMGRPFAGHRDSVSELVGDVLESAIESELLAAGITFRKTRRAECVDGFDQAPDFIVPSEFNPQVVIEAKITEDDGTAWDKVTRIQHLGELAMSQPREGRPCFEVVACIAGRGFGVRRADMKKMLRATRGKVFTLENIRHLVRHTRLADFVTHS